MHSSDIRTTFLDFFRERGHVPVPASPLVPAEPTLLLTNAGMNQFTPYFLGMEVPEHRRVTSVQKCVRTTDIARVGRTARHATCFEMLGNFSFGDYFKQDTVAWAWELLTSRFGLAPDRLWITVYEGDDEAERLWRRVGVPASRIQRLGMADNFWSMGVPGPCGPNSDVTYDRGPAFGRDGGPAENSERYLELWGLVFMAFLRGEDDGAGSYPLVGELPAPCIDTGLGLDRLACVLQDVETICETDLLAPTLRAVEERAGRPYPGRRGGEESVSFRVVTEHVRTAAHLIADGVLPDREGRGYVLRRLLRRAAHHARRLGIDEPVLADLTETVVRNLGPVWPELRTHRDLIRGTVLAEEQGFQRTLRQGSRLLRTAIAKARAEGSGSLADATVFTLHDTYGFPVDLTLDVAREAGLTVDEDALRVRWERQRRQARRAEQDRKGRAAARRETYRRLAVRHGRTEFLGYDRTVADGRLLALVDGDRTLDEAPEGAHVEIVLDRSPFYAEAGGQVGDTGTLRTSAGAELRVVDTTYATGGLQVHTAVVTRGEVRPGEEVEAVVDAERRAAISRSHTATHILHAVLRRHLGEHAVQRGSRVEPGRLRLDIAHPGLLGPDHLGEIQDRVDRELLADPEVRIWYTGRAEAEAAGALALFGETYGDEVRVVDIGEISRELCGGTHVAHGAGAGPVILLGTSSVGSGLRRIEALTGIDALRHGHRERALLDELAALLKVPAEEAPRRLRQRLDDLARAERKLAQLRVAELDAEATRLSARAIPCSGRWLVGELVTGLSTAELRSLGRDVLARLPTPGGPVILGAEMEGRAMVYACVDDTSAGSLSARRLLARAAAVLEGGVGGDDRRAQAGGRRTDRLAEALAVAVQTARDALGD